MLSINGGEGRCGRMDQMGSAAQNSYENQRHRRLHHHHDQDDQGDHHDGKNHHGEGNQIDQAQLIILMMVDL